MKPTTSLLPLLLSAFTSSELLYCFRGEQAILDAPPPVPGNSSFTFCQDPKDYSLDIKYANVSVKYVHASPALMV